MRISSKGKFIALIVFAFAINLQAQKQLQHLFSADSLKGFDQKSAEQEMVSVVQDPADFKGFMTQKMRSYIDTKYHLNKKSKNIADPYMTFNQIQAYNGKLVNGNNNSVFAAPCVNEGFELGNISGWNATIGANTNFTFPMACNYSVLPTPTTIGAPNYVIQTTPFFDPIIGVVPNSPFAGNKVVKMNDGVATGDYRAVRLSQNFPVTTSNFLFEFAYMAVMNGVHGCCDQPFMHVRVRDCIGILQSCPVFSITPPSVGCPGTGPTTWSVVGQNKFNTSWQKYSIDLTQFIGSCVTIEVTVSDCVYGGHFGYAYFDANCSNFGITLNGSSVFSAPTQTVNVPAPCATTATLSAPGGLNPYLWNGPAGSGITNNTNQTISTAVPGDYTLQMTPFGVCNPITRIVRLYFEPPIGVSATPTAICSAGTNTISVLTATGATTYSWSTNQTTPTISVSPVATTIYTLTAFSTTCTGTRTVQVTVNTNPVVSVSSNTNVVCTGGNVTLTASGASTYTWFPGGANGSSIVVTPTASTTYTVFGSNGGCPGTNTILISTISSPTVFAFSSAATVCPGANVNLFAGGASTYTWQPGNLVGAVVVANPTVNTTYTVTGSLLTCTDTETVSVAVSSGPTLNVVSNPTTLCSASGGTASLVASGAVSYTWNPGLVISPTLIISPTTTTSYTLTGANGIGCTTTNTITFSVTPTPTLNVVASSSAICAGKVATLTATGASNYTWNPGGFTVGTITVSPAANTTYTVIGANGSCTSVATISLVVNANPTVTAGSSPTVICSGNSSTLTASGALNYTWNPGSILSGTTNVTPSTSTNYTVIGANAAGCTATAAAIVSVNITPTITPVASPSNICLGNSSTLSVSGATGYTWNPGNLTGSSIVVTPTASVIYTVVGSNGNCSNTRTLSLIVNPTPTVNASANPTVICAGQTATLIAGGATSYTWSPGSLTGATVNVSPLTNTTYTVRGSNGTCTNAAVVSVSVNANPTLVATSNPTSICAGVGATSTLTGSGALTFTWNPGNLSGSSVTVSPASSTTYTLSGSNAAGCSSSSTVNVLVVPVPTVNVASSSTAVCSGKSATLTANGATSYTWNPGSLSGATVIVSPLTNTTYTVIGANGSCTSSNTISIAVNANPTVSALSNPTVICSGNSSTLSASGASSYTWNPGAVISSTAVVNPTSTTNYTVTGANAAGCTASAVAIVSVNTTPTINPVASPTAICFGGSSTLSSTGASSYTWNPDNLSGNSVVVSPTATTVYTVSGANGNCSDTKTVNVTVNPIPTVAAVVNPTLICASSPATLTGSGAISYTWLPVNLSGANVVVNPTVSTTYTVIGSSLSCTNTATVSINVNSTPTLVTIASPSNICSGTGGSSTLTASGAVSYTWNPGATVNSSIVVTPTTTSIYTVTGSSALGCTSSQTVAVQITPTPTLLTNASSTAICAGKSTTLNASGALSYTWNPGSLTGGTVVVSPTVNTTYTVTGVNGICSSTQTLAIVVNSNPTVTALSNPTVICSGNTSTLTGSGATSYTWNPGSILSGTTTVSPVSTTNYTLTGSNASGCTATAVAIVSVNITPTINAVASPTAICVGNSSTLTSTGATTYTWLPSSTVGSSIVVSPTVNTTYTVIGANTGCTSTRTLALVVNPNPTITVALPGPTVMCSGSGGIIFALSGVTSATWQPGNFTGILVTVNPSVTTNYTITGSNASGCTATAIAQASVVPTPTINLSATSTSICSGSSTTLSANGAGSYTWQPGNSTGSVIAVTPTATTIYTVTGSNAFCTSSRTIQINVTPIPTVNATASPTAVCLGNTSILSASGATSYTWNPGNFVSTNLAVTPTTTSIYTVTGSNGNCVSAPKTVQVVVNPLPSFTISAIPTNTICSGNAVSIIVLPQVGIYTLQPGNVLFTSITTITPSVTTIYTVTGTNGNCTGTRTLQIFVNPTPTLNVSGTPTAICSGNTSTLIASGATTYTWLPGSITGATAVVTPSATTIYTVTGTSNNCSSTRTLQINVTPTPSTTALASPTVICRNSSSTLTANGASSYTWFPGSISASLIVVTPSVTTNYTVVGGSGSCTNQAVVTVSVRPIPNINTFANPNFICSGSSSTLAANGAASFTWNPGSIVGQTIVVTPTATTIYTVTGTNFAGCTNTATRVVNVIPSPTLSIAASNTAICYGSTASFTASGANGYTWSPTAVTNSVLNVIPIPGTIVFTVTGNVGFCVSTKTVSLLVHPNPTVTANTSSTVVCANSNVTLTANGASTYTWLPGPLSGSLVTVNPLVSTTYTVIGAGVGSCTNLATVNVSVSPGPSISATLSSGTICAGNNVTLTPSGANTYTLLPGNGTGTVFVVSPTVTTSYTVLGSNSIGCPGVTTLQINVDPLPVITITPSANGICTGNSVTLTAGGASSYTWLPSLTTGNTFTDAPFATTVYTVIGQNAFGCSSTATISIGVTPIPTINATASQTLVCQSTPVLLTGFGATNYTWTPGSIVGSTVYVTPTVTTIYTLTADNGGCASTTTVEVQVTPGPTGVAASATGTITCFVSSVNLLGSTTSTNVSYSWSGPGSFTSAVQSPIGITVGGTYTLTVTDLNTGCSLSATTAVITNTTIPNFTVTSSGDLGCNTTSTLMAASSTSAGITYTWSGPATFTSALQSPTVNTPGVYTVSAFDISTGCVSSLTIAVNSDTSLPVFSATILPATCNGSVTNNDGTIIVSGNGVKFDYVAGTTYTGTSVYTTATPIPTTGIITNTLVNPSAPTPYTVRIYGFNGCFKDTTLFLQPVNCDNRVFGLTKAASTPSLVNNLYQVTYTVTAVNASATDNLTNVTLNENLNNTFPLPTTYTIINAPVVTSLGTSLTINPLFDGSSQISLTTPSLSTILPGKRDTIVFTVLIKPNGFFGPFVNSVIGTALDVNSLIVADSSNDGFSWDPDANGTPTDNNIPTVINLLPNSRLGIAKAASLSQQLSDKTYDITYVITVKNFGNDTLRNVQVKDSLTKTVPLPAQFTIKTAPSITGTLLTTNPGFNGASDVALLSGTNALAPGQTDTIRFTINVNPDTVTVIRNTATAFAFDQFSLTVVRDTSHTGTNPDPNGDGNPNELDPTVVVLPTSTLTIPEVFTPNDDGKNDNFVIKGLNGRKVKLTVFNRWGNKVYENGEYDNSWNGYPNINAMVVGNSRLPQGTYYYIVEFLDKDKEVKTGFVVLQY